MRLNNRNKIPLFNFFNTFLLLVLLGGVGTFIIDKIRFKVLGWESSLLIIVPIFLLGVFYFMGRQIFEYDSDGEALNFKNRNIIPFLDKPASDEFPKYKLLKFEVINLLIVKRLYVTISSKKANATTLKYDVSFLTSKEINDLKFSLNKVVKANKENKVQQEVK